MKSLNFEFGMNMKPNGYVVTDTPEGGLRTEWTMITLVTKPVDGNLSPFEPAILRCQSKRRGRVTSSAPVVYPFFRSIQA